MSAAAVLVGVALLGGVPVAAEKPGCRTKACEVRVAKRQCEAGSVRACIRRAALHRGQSYGDMLRVAWCESRLRPRAVSPGGHVGLFQFARGTWATTPYARRDPFSAKWSSLAAAWMWQVGRRNEWACR